MKLKHKEPPKRDLKCRVCNRDLNDEWILKKHSKDKAGHYFHCYCEMHITDGSREELGYSYLLARYKWLMEQKRLKNLQNKNKLLDVF